MTCRLHKVIHRPHMRFWRIRLRKASTVRKHAMAISPLATTHALPGCIGKKMEMAETIPANNK